MSKKRSKKKVQSFGGELYVDPTAPGGIRGLDGLLNAVDDIGEKHAPSDHTWDPREDFDEGGPDDLYDGEE
jgi:hypothetical protein